MKKFLVLFIAMFVAFSAIHVQAQSTKKVVGAASINTAGTIITFQYTPSKLFAVQASVAKTSGTIAGKVYLQGTIDGNWVNLDSLTLSDQATNTKIFPITRTSYLSYQLSYVPTGTQQSVLTGSYLRRTDE